ncbi:alpha/beta hydrolase [Luteimonas sp. SX5]|uniref:Alpha/beta hydrolase n=1 Tax=Luteimonas galliterrae TaxID=2940486 RepID=A0ABT0MFE9_9GAMM|nr:alpha/beta hydrolase [Luteimonas galliterrae]MCL1633577.1 alpha/beta hydrolase [Luteimonas galliterrae]
MAKTLARPASPRTGLAKRMTRIGGQVALSGLRFRLRVGAKLQPGRTLARACELFCTPLPQSRQRAAMADMSDAARETMRIAGLGIATYRWGDPEREPYVLLSHGWSSSASVFRPWVPRLRQAGYAVVAFDQPAHGLSEGRCTNLPGFVETLHAVADRHGAAAALIGHSLGGAASAVALAQGLPTPRAILVSPSADLAAATRRFTSLMRLPEDFGERMIDAFVDGPVPIHELQAHRIAPRIEADGLILHDLEDREIPCEEGERYARHWPRARMIRTRGLGHTRILADERVMAAAVAFLAGMRPGDVIPPVQG